MKKLVLIVAIVFGLSLSFAGLTWSLTINSGAIDVGIKDTLLFSSLLSNSGNQTEINWVNSVLGTSFTEQDKYDTIANDWTKVDNTQDIWALDLKDSPLYFLIKIGTGDKVSNTHYLYWNNDKFDWAVVALSDFQIQKVMNIGRFSHVGEFGSQQVPEPSTLLLLGGGLLGLALYGRKRFGK